MEHLLLSFLLFCNGLAQAHYVEGDLKSSDTGVTRGFNIAYEGTTAKDSSMPPSTQDDSEDQDPTPAKKGTSGKKSDPSKWTWTVPYSYSAYTTKGQNPNTTETTHSFSPDLKYWWDSTAKAGLTYNYSLAVETKMSQGGPLLTLSKKWKWNLDQDFADSFKITARAGNKRFAIIAGNKLTRELIFNQTQLGGSAEYSPLSWLTLGASGDQYSYDKRLNQTLTAAEKLALKNVADTLTSLETTVSTYYASFYIGEEWTIEPSESRSTLEVDGSETVDDSVTLSYQPTDNWYFTAAIGSSKSSTSTSASGYGSIGITYNF